MSTVTLPAYWASALINGDYSGLKDSDPEEAKRCRAKVKELAAEGWSVEGIDGQDEDGEVEARFTWSYDLYDPGAGVSGGEVLDYIILRSERG